MTQKVTAQDGTVHHFPDEATPAMIAEAMGLSGGSPGVVAQKPPQGVLADTAAMASNVAQGGTFGWADEIGAGIAKPVTYALKNILPEGYGGEGVTYDEVSRSIDATRGKNMSDLAAWNEENPLKAFGSQVAGGIATGGAFGKMAASAAPEVTSALSTFAKAHPYYASAGLGGVTGSVYGAGASEDGERLEGAVLGGASGAVLGPALNFVGNRVVSPALEKGKGFLQKFLTASEAKVPASAPAAGNVVPPLQEYSNITNKPLGAPPVPEAKGATMLTGNLPLSPGVKAKDANLLRIEDQAKEGLLGSDAQNQMRSSINAVFQGARNAMQQLKGITNKDSDGLLADSVARFQKEANTVKTGAQALYKQRDELMAGAVLNKNKVAPSLGKSLNDVVNEPTSVSGFKSKSGAPAKALYDDFMSMIKGTEGKELPFSDLAAWRQDVAHLAKTDESTAGTMAKRLASAYDDWMDNITQDHFLKGDPNVADVARKAGSAWKNYKTLFGSENSPIIEGMTKPYDMNPADFVNGVFGKSIEGTAKTALNVRKMAAALPPEAQQEFKNNIFSGLVSKVFEGASNADSLSLAQLRNNLSKLQSSQVFKEQFAKDGDKNTVITNLIKDLTQHIEQTGRKDITSPSGGAIMRGLKALTAGATEIPVVRAVPGVRAADGLVNTVSDISQASMDRKAFNAAMKNMAKQAHAAARGKKVFEIDALKSGLAGGTTAGTVIQMNSKKKKQ